MANNADVTYIIVSKNNQIIEQLNNAFRDMSIHEWDIYKAMESLGIDTENLSVRAEIQDCCMELDASMITINMIGAWSHQEDFKIAIEQRYPDEVEVYWLEYEPGCDVFMTNDTEDKYFHDNYIVDYDCQEEWYRTLDDVVEIYKDVLGEFPNGTDITFDMVKERADAYTESNEDDCKFMYIFQLERIGC